MLVRAQRSGSAESVDAPFAHGLVRIPAGRLTLVSQGIGGENRSAANVIDLQDFDAGARCLQRFSAFRRIIASAVGSLHRARF